MFVEIDNERFDALPQLSREMINETSNGSVLADWYDTLIEKAAELHDFVGAMRHAGIEMDGAAGKMAYCQIAARWVERRLLALDHPVPYPPSDGRAKEINRLHRRLERLRQQVRDLGGDPNDSKYQPGETA